MSKPVERFIRHDERGQDRPSQWSSLHETKQRRVVQDDHMTRDMILSAVEKRITTVDKMRHGHVRIIRTSPVNTDDNGHKLVVGSREACIVSPRRGQLLRQC